MTLLDFKFALLVHLQLGIGSEGGIPWFDLSIGRQGSINNPKSDLDRVSPKFSDNLESSGIYGGTELNHEIGPVHK